jgi:hypothetical protein
MRRVFAVMVLLVFSVACGTERGAPTPTVAPTQVASSIPGTTPTTPPKPTAPPGPPSFDVAKAMEHVRALSVEIGKREAGSRADEIAGDYIANAIEVLGWASDEQPFQLPQGGSSTNVIGTPPGFTTDEPYLIVGGHRDSIVGPGANDNATGIGAALEIARIVDIAPVSYPVMFIAFGAEERQPAAGRPHHIGSVHYVAQMSLEARENLVAFVNLDMIGHGDVITCGRLAVGPQDGTKRCTKLAKELKIAAQERVLPDWSDHGSFQKKDMNTAWLWTGTDPCCYHNAQDVYDHVRPADVARSGKLALAIIRSYKD